MIVAEDEQDFFKEYYDTFSKANGDQRTSLVSSSSQRRRGDSIALPLVSLRGDPIARAAPPAAAAFTKTGLLDPTVDG